MRITWFFLFLLFQGVITSVKAQSYGTTLGLRLGNNESFRMAGITAQQRILKKVTLEGILQTDFNHNHSVHILGEAHKNIISKRLNFYVGAGISAGLEENTTVQYFPNEKVTTTTYNNGTMGVDLLAGLELTLLKLNVSLDYKPNINMVGREEWYQGQVGISVRSVLVSQKAWRKNAKERTKQKRQDERSSSQNQREPKLKSFFQDVFGQDNQPLN